MQLTGLIRIEKSGTDKGSCDIERIRLYTHDNMDTGTLDIYDPLQLRDLEQEVPQYCSGLHGAQITALMCSGRL